jgi:hypothetical protein
MLYGGYVGDLLRAHRRFLIDSEALYSVFRDAAVTSLRKSFPRISPLSSAA